MKKLVIAVSLLFAAVICARAQQSVSVLGKAARLAYDFLVEEGYKPSIDEDDDVIFKAQGYSFYVDNNVNDETYLRVVLPAIEELEDEDDIAATFAYLLEKLGDRHLYVVKELTKLYESVYETRLAAPIDFDTHGEFVLIVDGMVEGDSTALTPEEHVRRYMAMGMVKKEAIKAVAKERGVPKDEIYKAALLIDDDDQP